MLEKMMKSVLEQDRAAVVLCDLEDTIVYMNPAAKENYRKYNGGELVGRNLLNCHNPRSGEMIHKVVAWFAADPSHNLVHTFFNEKQQKDVYMVALRDEEGKLIGYYEKHEYRTRDDMPFYAIDGQD